MNKEIEAFGSRNHGTNKRRCRSILSVMQYLVIFSKEINEDKIIHFPLTAAEIGCIFKKSATTSGAMCGCQADGVSSACCSFLNTSQLSESITRAKDSFLQRKKTSAKRRALPSFALPLHHHRLQNL